MLNAMDLENWRAMLLARWKFLLSFRKRDWELEDYPVVVHRQHQVAEWGNEPRFRSPAYIAHLVKWPGMDGLGDTPAGAIRDLREAFARVCAHRGSKPRPGTPVPIQIASQQQVDRQQELADEFVHSVLGVENAFLTDKSELWHFALAGALDEYYDRIQKLYGVDVRDVPEGNIAQILERIGAAQHGRGKSLQ